MQMSTQETIVAVARRMREYERASQYVDAEKARLHLEELAGEQEGHRRHPDVEDGLRGPRACGGQSVWAGIGESCR